MIKKDGTKSSLNRFLILAADTTVFWKFDEEKDFERWVTTADSDWGEGYSKCELVQSPNGKAIFRVRSFSSPGHEQL